MNLLRLKFEVNEDRKTVNGNEDLYLFTNNVKLIQLYEI
jgi:hypothetical protein